MSKRASSEKSPASKASKLTRPWCDHMKTALETLGAKAYITRTNMVSSPVDLFSFLLAVWRACCLHSTRNYDIPKGEHPVLCLLNNMSPGIMDALVWLSAEICPGVSLREPEPLVTYFK